MAFSIVSGGGTGIGAATAAALAADGHDVLIVGRRPDPLAQAADRVSSGVGRPDAVVAVAADLSTPAGVHRVVEATGGRAVDVLVNNAGGYVDPDPALPDPPDLDGVAGWWRRNFDTNVLSAVLLTAALLPQLRRPGGRVVLLSSIAAQRGGGGPYSAAKAALHGWVYDLAREVGPDGITANVISPGYVAETEFFGDRMTPDGYASRVSQTLVGRAGVPADIAAAVRFLTGPDSGYVTGQVIGVNGGSVLGR